MLWSYAIGAPYVWQPRIIYSALKVAHTHTQTLMSVYNCMLISASGIYALSAHMLDVCVCVACWRWRVWRSGAGARVKANTIGVHFLPNQIHALFICLKAF